MLFKLSLILQSFLCPFRLAPFAKFELIRNLDLLRRLKMSAFELSKHGVIRLQLRPVALKLA